MADWSQFELDTAAAQPQGGGVDMSQFELDSGAASQQSPEQLIGGDTNTQRFGRAAVGGLSKILPFNLGDEIVAGGSSGIDMLGALGREAWHGNVPSLSDIGNNLSNDYSARLGEVRDYQKAIEERAPKTAAGISLGGAMLMPTPGWIGEATGIGAKTMAGASEAGLLSAGYGFGGGEGDTTNRVLDAAHAGLTGEALGAGMGAISSVLGGVADLVRPPSAEDEAIQALKIRAGDVGKVEKYKGEGALDSSIQGAKDRGVFSGDGSVNSIADANQTAIDSLHDRATDLLKAADAAQTSAPALSLDNVRKVVAKDPFNESSLLSQLQNRMETINQKWDGTVSGLNELKRSLKFAWRQGDNGALDRALYQDLREAVEQGADNVAPGVGAQLRGLNKQIGQHLDLEPIIDRAQRGETAAAYKAPGTSPLAALASGGIKGGLLGGIAQMATGAHLAAPGYLLGAGLKALANSPTAMGGIASGLDSLASLGESSTGPMAEIISSLASRGTEPQSSKQQQKLEAPSPNSPANPVQKQAKPSAQAVMDVLYNAVRHVESSDGKNLIGPPTKYGTAKGPVQLLDDTGLAYHKKLGIEDPYDPFDESQSKAIFEAKMRDLLAIYGGDLELALLAYHTGEGNIAAGRIGPQGKAYPAKVIAALKGTA